MPTCILIGTRNGSSLAVDTITSAESRENAFAYARKHRESLRAMGFVSSEIFAHWAEGPDAWDVINEIERMIEEGEPCGTVAVRRIVRSLGEVYARPLDVRTGKGFSA